MAVDFKRSEMLRTHRYVVSFLLQTYATDEAIAEAGIHVVNFRQTSAMTEETYSRMLLDKALRCGIVFSGRRLKSLFILGLLSETWAQTRQFLSFTPRLDYHTVARQTQALGDNVRATRRLAATAPAIGNNEETRFRREAKALSIESSSAECESDRGEEAGSEVLALNNSYIPPRGRSANPSSPFSSH